MYVSEHVNEVYEHNFLDVRLVFIPDVPSGCLLGSCNCGIVSGEHFCTFTIYNPGDTKISTKAYGTLIIFAKLPQL